MPFSWSVIRANAQKFAKDWGEATSERAEVQTFWTADGGRRKWNSDGARVAFLFDLYLRLTNLQTATGEPG